MAIANISQISAMYFQFLSLKYKIFFSSSVYTKIQFICMVPKSFNLLLKEIQHANYISIYVLRISLLGMSIIELSLLIIIFSNVSQLFSDCFGL